ncbi:flagellar basal body rod protein FlgC [Peribacillus muralis]|uniref:flagellar basal body rod protein FlgC n=1 Tax=Peribacillus muralis TaxID=264697 RepID=UPI00070A4EE8|nr:flagellar basal body rod protein FlgC [Peribacillus muralis]MCK1992483.1 flagellar basal body rod protein FlgC [Peribacillus muralis]MCK2013039.1 flagellar basal body rod protein FlgC [Peribacillus muralis]
MGIFQSINMTGSSLTSQRLRMDVISANMANAETTRGEYDTETKSWKPYTRKSVVLQSKEVGFSSFLNAASQETSGVGNGVKVTEIVKDKTPFKLDYNPDHPDANEAGYVEMPNVDPLREMVDLMSVTRSYEANVTVLNASKGMMMKALEIGK